MPILIPVIVDSNTERQMNNAIFCKSGLIYISFYVFTVQDTEVLMSQLSKDQEAVDQVRFIVEAEETTMKRETQIVQDYADVSIMTWLR